MLSFIFVLPEILLSFGFMIYFIYSVYIKIDQRVLFYSVFSKVYQLFRLNILNKFNLESLDLQDRILVIRKELSLKLNLE